MNARTIERASYLAMHALRAVDLNAPELACPGARNSRLIDAGAKIIANVFTTYTEPQPYEKETDDTNVPTLSYTGI